VAKKFVGSQSFVFCGGGFIARSHNSIDKAMMLPSCCVDATAFVELLLVMNTGSRSVLVSQ
jgi:hypothetical protein